MSDFTNIGVLWKPTKEGSKAILQGKLGNANLYIFPNNFKTEDKHPDYTVCVANPQKKEEVVAPKEETKAEDATDFPF